MKSDKPPHALPLLSCRDQPLRKTYHQTLIPTQHSKVPTLFARNKPTGYLCPSSLYSKQENQGTKGPSPAQKISFEKSGGSSPSAAIGAFLIRTLEESWVCRRSRHQINILSPPPILTIYLSIPPTCSQPVFRFVSFRRGFLPRILRTLGDLVTASACRRLHG